MLTRPELILPSIRYASPLSPYTMLLSPSEAELLHRLRNAPANFGYRYTPDAQVALLQELFRALGCGSLEYMTYLFMNGLPTEGTPEAWKLSTAQGAMDGAEYSPAARGKPCGHIFKFGEATYRCK